MLHIVEFILNAVGTLGGIPDLKKPPSSSVAKPSLRKLENAENKDQPLWWWIATWFGSGLSPFASGTAGSLAALPFAYLIQVYFGDYGNLALMAAAFAMFFIGWWASNEYLKHNPGVDDPGQIVVDEVAGQWLLLAVLFPTWQSYLVGFLLFRAFDVVKPWPVSWADQKIKGGLGVMFDDTLAALYPILLFLLIILEARFFGSQKLLQPIINFLGDIHVRPRH